MKHLPGRKGLNLCGQREDPLDGTDGEVCYYCSLVHEASTKPTTIDVDAARELFKAYGATLKPDPRGKD